MAKANAYGKWLKAHLKGDQWPKRAAIVSVIWDDATYCEDMERSGLSRAATFGVVVEATKDHIKTAAEVFEDKTVRDITTIPAGMVQRVVELGEAPVP